MQALSKTLVLLLLAAVIMAPLAAQGLRPDAPSQQRAGCHENEGNVPAPGPASHSCCLGAHHPAILQQSCSLRVSLHSTARLDLVPHSAAVTVPGSFPNPVIVPGDPPMLSPLRV